MPLPGSGNVSSVLPKLNISDLYRRLPQEKIMHVNLPKVKLQYRQELQKALTSMGEEMHKDFKILCFWCWYLHDFSVKEAVRMNKIHRFLCNHFCLSIRSWFSLFWSWSFWNFRQSSEGRQRPPCQHRRTQRRRCGGISRHRCYHHALHLHVLCQLSFPVCPCGWCLSGPPLYGHCHKSCPRQWPHA